MTVITNATPGQQRIARPAEGGRDEREGQHDRERPEPRPRPFAELAQRGGEVGERAAERVLELLGEDDVPEPGPRVRRAVHERGPERPGAQRELEEHQDRGERNGGEAGGDERRPPPDPRLDREHEQADRRDEQQGQRVVPERQAEDRRPRR